MSTTTQSGHPVRSALRSTGVLGLSLLLTTGVVVLLSGLVDAWT